MHITSRTACFLLLVLLVAAARADDGARVVVDQRTGTVVVTGWVRIGRLAVTHGNLVVRTRGAARAAHPGPFAAAGESVAVPRSRIRIEQGKRRRLVVLPANATLRQLVDRLNELGLSPRDLVSVLQAIKASGALNAELVVR